MRTKKSYFFLIPAMALVFVSCGRTSPPGEERQQRPAASPLGGAFLGLDWDFPRRPLGLYLRGGAELVFETTGPIPLPGLELGLRLQFPRRAGDAGDLQGILRR